MYRVRQELYSEETEDAPGEVSSALERSGLKRRLTRGDRIALTAGSRGIDRIDEVLGETVSWLRQRGARPFILAAMGSHGGGTASGRKKVLEARGITQASMGAPVRAGSRITCIGRAEGVPLYCASEALQADGVIVINRVKPHTSFSGKYESGLAKMMAVGMGEQKSAPAVHARGASGLARLVPAMAKVMLKKAPVIAGMALVENGRDRLLGIKVLSPSRIMKDEPELLEEARAMRPRLPFDHADALVVDRMGKDFSGTGMDTEVIGRLHIAGEPEPALPCIRRIAVLRLSEGAGGNAYGVGLADVTTDALVQSMDADITRTNVMASTFIERARIPLSFPSDRKAIAAALQTSGNPDPQTWRVARISDTLDLEELLVSKPLLGDMEKEKRKIELREGPLHWRFDSRGNLDLE